MGKLDLGISGKGEMDREKDRMWNAKTIQKLKGKLEKRIIQEGQEGRAFCSHVG